jgi:hypothetical protein
MVPKSRILGFHQSEPIKNLFIKNYDDDMRTGPLSKEEELKDDLLDRSFNAS